VPSDRDQTTRVPAYVALAAVLAVGAVIGLLVFLLLGVGRLNTTLEETNDRLAATTERVDRIGDDVDPLRTTVRAELQRIRPRVSRIGGDVDAVATESLPNVETNTRAIAGAVVALAEDVDEAFAAQPVGDTVRQAHELFALIERLELVEKAARGTERLPELATTVTDIHTTLQRVADLLVATRGELGASRQVQCLTLRHIESIDRKTGGPLPPDGQLADPPPAACQDVPTAAAAVR
jgi:hypothetical protein